MSNGGNRGERLVNIFLRMAGDGGLLGKNWYWREWWNGGQSWQWWMQVVVVGKGG